MSLAIVSDRVEPVVNTEVTESKKPISTDPVASIAQQALKGESVVLLAGHFTVIDFRHKDITIRPEYPAIVVVVEGFALGLLKCVGAAYYSQKSPPLLTKMLEALNDTVENVSFRFIIPIEEDEPYKEIFANITKEVGVCKIPNKKYLIWPTSPEKIIITPKESFCQVFQSDV